MKHPLPSQFKLVAGLGNSGEEYLDTYHNAGFVFVEALAGTDANWRHHKSFESFRASNSVFVRPLLFMNRSGSAIQEALRYFKIHKEKLLVVHDDSDLLLGAHKLVFGRGGAGHHGVESIIEALGTKNFWRLRIGIRPPSFRERKAGDFVLKKMKKEEKQRIQELAYFVNLKLRLNETPDAVVDKFVSGSSTF